MRNVNTEQSIGQYRIYDGTSTGERINVWAHDLLNRAALGNMALTARHIKHLAWMKHFGVTLEPQTSIQTGQHMAYHINSRSGRYTYASLDEIYPDTFEADPDSWPIESTIGFAEHRPILGKLGKIAMKLELPIPKKLETPRRAYIQNIDVLPQHQHSGVGAAILDFALRSYPPRAEVVLEAVGPRNYTHEWFENLGLKPNPSLELEPINISDTALQQMRYDSASVEDVIDALNAERFE